MLRTIWRPTVELKLIEVVIRVLAQSVEKVCQRFIEVRPGAVQSEVFESDRIPAVIDEDFGLEAVIIERLSEIIPVNDDYAFAATALTLKHDR